MDQQSPFKWRHFEADIILLCVHWHLRYALSTVDKNAPYPKAFKELKEEGTLPQACELRQVKYLNNIVKQDHRFIKRLVKPGLGFFSFETAWNTLQGYESLNMIRKGQVHGVEKGNILCLLLSKRSTTSAQTP